MSSLPTRWAAIGAAVAVTLGAGGLLTANAASEASVFVAIEPTRVLDTRIDAGLTGPLVNSTARKLDVTGTIPIVLPGNKLSTGAPVPDGATAIVANVTGISPSTVGFLAVRPGTATGSPASSNLNFTTAGVIVPNSVTVELPTTGTAAGAIDLFFFGDAPGATLDVAIDVVGYYRAGGAGTPGPEGPRGPEGPAGTAAAYARVAADGSISLDSGNISVERIADGFYCVGVSGATVHIAVANLDAQKNLGGSVQTGVFSSSGCPAGHTDIVVITRDQARDGGLPGNDKAFYILVN